MRLALARLNLPVGAFDRNFTKIDAAVSRAKAADADLVVFSEMATTGYPPRDLLNHSRCVDMNLTVLDRGAAMSADRLGILIGFVDRNPASEGKALYNAAALCHSGRVVGRRYKSLLSASPFTLALLLSTGNKSELAVGYCTLYGDIRNRPVPAQEISEP